MKNIPTAAGVSLGRSAKFAAFRREMKRICDRIDGLPVCLIVRGSYLSLVEVLTGGDDCEMGYTVLSWSLFVEMQSFLTVNI